MKNVNIMHDAGLFIKTSGDEIYNIATRDGGVCIDGGAAAGFVTKSLLNGPECKVLAFEPFPGNVPHFKANVGDDSRVTFFQKALGNHTGPGQFFVKSIVDGNQPGWNHLPGYSSVGYLLPGDRGKATEKQSFEVQVVRLEDYVHEEVTLLKLDLQGGEYDALVGLGQKISFVKYCYVEFSLDWRIIDILAENGFVLFDTQYTGIPKVPIDELTDVIQHAEILNLSNGFKAIKGTIRGLPRDLKSYREFLEGVKARYFYHLWSDLIGVNAPRLRAFFSSALK